MAKIVKRATAGTMESSDAFVQIAPADDLEIELHSVVEEQFGEDIRALIRRVLNESGIQSAHLRVEDRGALDCVLEARIRTAVSRAAEGTKKGDAQ